jgi:hypothetical protein
MLESSHPTSTEHGNATMSEHNPQIHTHPPRSSENALAPIGEPKPCRPYLVYDDTYSPMAGTRPRIQDCFFTTFTSYNVHPTSPMRSRNRAPCFHASYHATSYGGCPTNASSPWHRPRQGHQEQDTLPSIQPSEPKPDHSKRPLQDIQHVCPLAEDQRPVPFLLQLR